MMVFVPNEAVNAVFVCETVEAAILVIADALPERASYSDVDRPVLPAGGDIDGGLFPGLQEFFPGVCGR
jgi:hypothetical protein